MSLPFHNGWKKCRSAFLLLGLLALLLPCKSLSGAGAVRSTLFSETEVNRIGLTRPWFNQVMMDIGQSRISHITLQDDTLFITTTAGRIHVIDGNTGTTLWSRLLGPVEYETFEPGVNSKIVAVIHGTTLHVLDRFDGRRLLEIPITAPPGAGPQVSEMFIYVPILTGKIYAYPIKPIPSTPSIAGQYSYEDVDALRLNEKLSATVRKELDKLLENKNIEKYSLMPVLSNEIQSCPALGHPIVQPVMTTQLLGEEFFGWVTENGKLLFGRTRFSDKKDALKLVYRISLSPEIYYTNDSHMKQVFVNYQNDMNYRPTFAQVDKSDYNARKNKSGDGGMLLVGAQTGFVFAVNDCTGNVDWQFCAGEGAIDPIGLSEDHCYITTYSGQFHCVALKDGQEQWKTKNVRQFVAATPSRIYVLDRYGNLSALDRLTGKKLDSIGLDLGTIAVFNVESDRIYLVAPDGLVQCLHEIDSPEPIRYRESAIERGARLEAERSDFLRKQAEAKAKERVIPLPANSSITPTPDNVPADDSGYDDEDDYDSDLWDDEEEDSSNPFK